MDADVIISTLGVLGLAMLASVMGLRLGRRLRPMSQLFLLAATMIATSVYASIIAGRLELATFVPFGSAVLATNLTPVLVWFSLGLAWHLPSLDPRSVRSRFSLVAALSLVFFFAPVIRPWMRPVASDEPTRFVDGICMQSHPASCGAAAAATLLYQHGISVTEQEMMSRCLTSSDGTEPLGLYQGLRQETARRHVVPKVAAKAVSSWDSLGQYPLVALVTFREDEYRENDSSQAGGTLRRILGRHAEGHAVVILKQLPSGDFLVGDPAVGRTVWDQASFSKRFFGQAIYLAKR